MTIEKDVVIRLKVPQGGREGKAFEDMAKQAKGLEAGTKRAGQAVADMLKETAHVARITKALKDMGVESKAAGEAAARVFREIGDGAKIGQREIAKLAAGMKALGQTAPAGVAGGGGAGGAGIGGRLGRLGRAIGVGGGLGAIGAAGLPLAALGAGGQGISTYAEGRRTGEGFWSTAQRASENIPIFGNFFAQSNENRALHERDRRLAAARANVPYTEQRMAIQGQLQTQQRALRERGVTSYDALTNARAGQEAFAGSQETRLASSLAQDRARMEGRNPAEVAARFAHAEAIQGLGIRQGAERQNLSALTTFREGQVGAARGEVERARQQATGMASARPGENEAQAVERRLALENQLAVVQEKENQLAQAQASLLEAQSQKQQQIVQQSEQRVVLLGQERDRIQGAVAAEKERLTVQGRSFAARTSGEQARAIALGKRANQGEQLTRGEMTFLQGFQGTEKVTNRQLDQFSSGRVPEFQAVFGQREELQSLQQQGLKIDNNLKVEINMNAESVAQQIEQNILPKIVQIMTDLQQQAGTATTRLANEQRINQAQLPKGGE